MKNFLWLLVFISFSSSSDPELKGSPNDLRGFLYPKDTIISISDEAEKTAYSDLSVVSLVVTTEDKLLSVSMRKNTELRDAIRKSLVSKGVDGAEIKNSKFSSSPEYGWFGKSPSSYKVVNRMAIRISKEQHLQDIAELSDKHHELALSGVAFEHSKKDEFNLLVKDEALKKVLAKKNYYEKSLGFKLVPIRLRENQIGFSGTDGAAILEEVVVTGLRAQSSSMATKVRAPAVVRKNSFDEVKYSASVSVDFKVK